MKEHEQLDSAARSLNEAALWQGRRQSAMLWNTLLGGSGSQPPNIWTNVW